MSEYTYVNIFTNHPTEVRSEILLGGYKRVYNRDGLDLVYIRLGGDKRDLAESQLLDEKNSDIIYSIPPKGNLEMGDFVAYILIDKMEDTGNSHRTMLYRVEAYEEPKKIDEEYISDASLDAEEVEDYYADSYNLSPRLTL